MRSNAAKTAEILRELRTGTNGMVVEAMSRRGVDYPLSYGVAVTEIRTVAARYAPDHSLARTLYQSDVRELRLAALYIADPAQAAAEAAFWAKGISCPEVAEHAAALMGRAPEAQKVTLEWLASQDAVIGYAALMTAARAIMESPAAEWDMPTLILLLETAVTNPGPLEIKGLPAFLGRLWQKQPAARSALAPLLEKIKASPAAQTLWQELEWRLEE